MVRQPFQILRLTLITNVSSGCVIDSFIVDLWVCRGKYWFYFLTVLHCVVAKAMVKRWLPRVGLYACLWGRFLDKYVAPIHKMWLLTEWSAHFEWKFWRIDGAFVFLWLLEITLLTASDEGLGSLYCGRAFVRRALQLLLNGESGNCVPLYLSWRRNNVFWYLNLLVIQVVRILLYVSWEYDMKRFLSADMAEEFVR